MTATTYVLWRDAHDLGPGVWGEKVIDAEDVGVTIETYGMILLETDDWLVVGHSRDTVKLHPRGGFAIPKSCILERHDSTVRSRAR